MLGPWVSNYLHWNCLSVTIFHTLDISNLILYIVFLHAGSTIMCIFTTTVFSLNVNDDSVKLCTKWDQPSIVIAYQCKYPKISILLDGNLQLLTSFHHRWMQHDQFWWRRDTPWMILVLYSFPWQHQAAQKQKKGKTIKTSSVWKIPIWRLPPFPAAHHEFKIDIDALGSDKSLTK